MIDEKIKEEFIKSLWHDAKEEPKNNGYIITEYFDPDEKEVKYELDFIIKGRVKWEEYTTLNCIMKWRYLSDILPKEGETDEYKPKEKGE